MNFAPLSSAWPVLTPEQSIPYLLTQEKRIYYLSKVKITLIFGLSLIKQHEAVWGSGGITP
jgi:hypothetical protein